MAPPTPKPGRTALKLLLPPIAWLWLNVLLVTVRLRLLKMAPPAPVASRLPVQKLPARATLCVNQLSLTLAVAKLRMAPPWALPAEAPLLRSAPSAWFAVKALLEMVSDAEPRFATAPPRAAPTRPVGLVLGSPTAWLLDRTTLASVRRPKFKIPPPALARTGELPLARPSAIVIPAMVTVRPALMSKTRLAWLPLTVSWFAPGPSMSRFLVMANSPPISVMVWPARLGAKSMVSPLWAAAISPRSEPSPRAPVSRALVTVSVLGTQRFSSASRWGRKVAGRRLPAGA